MKFKYICDLFERLERVETADAAHHAKIQTDKHQSIIQYWFRDHRTLITDYEALLSCLLPAQRVDRVYGMGRSRVSRAFADCLGLGASRCKRLHEAPETEDLALLLESLVAQHGGGIGGVSATLSDVDQCFAQLAAITRFSGPKVRADIPESTPRHQRDILRPVITRLQSKEIKWFIRLLFKNLASVQLDYQFIVKVAHPLLPQALKVRESFHDALALLDDARVRTHMDDNYHQIDSISREILEDSLRPKVGSKIARPRFLKARSFKNCADLVGPRRWAIEPKYDGEYCQVHVDLTQGANCLQIFSKSGKDSTRDRAAVHGWLKEALQIGQACGFEKRCILEGELIVVDTRDNTIQAFDKIRKHVSRSGSFLGTKHDSPCHEHERLQVMFYDVLMIDDDMVLHKPYVERRQRLKQILPPRPGSSCRGHWSLLDFTTASHDQPRMIERALKYCFKKTRAKRDEGLVLKPADGSYLDFLPKQHAQPYNGVFIKLKGDYIPGLGDTADFAVVGAYTSSKHNIEPELLKQTKWTHFVLACLVNKSEVRAQKARPVLKVMGAVSRPCLSAEDMRFLSQHGQFRQSDQAGRGQTSFDLETSGVQGRPTIQFTKPFIVDVLGSSFERPPNAQFHMLRHPRIVKIHNNDRDICDIVSFNELQSMAMEALKIPNNVLEEEKKILQQIKQACQPKRSQFLESQSPARTNTSTASPASTRSSRTPNVLVRMDSCEMQDGDHRFVSPLAVKAARGKLLSTTKTATSAEPAMAKKTPSVERETRTRGAAHLQEISPPKKLCLQHSRSDLSEQTRHMQAVQTVHEKIAAPDARSVGEIFTTAPSSLTELAKFRPSPTDHFNMSAADMAAKSDSPRLMHHEGIEQIWDAHALPFRLDRTSPLKDVVIYVAPKVFGPDELIDPLIQSLRGYRVLDIQDWHRDQRPLARLLGPVVGESQSEDGADKLVLIDCRLGRGNEDLIDELMMIRLGLQETIDIWDWRALEAIQKLASFSVTGSFSKREFELLAETAERYLFGTVRLTTQTASDAVKEMGFKKATEQVVELRNARYCRLAQVFEEGQDGQEQMNIFDVGGDGSVSQALKSWIGEIRREKFDGR
ncbi:MAG: hypothetical protein Q9159_000170 [Coniocarpon cinnabarinum]